MTRISYLDGLRGWAALVVVAHHVLMSFYPALYWQTAELTHTGDAWEQLIHGTPLSIFFNGGLAVAVFLILSGYVLTMQFRYRPFEKNASFFGISRFIRFFLLMLATNLLAYIALKAGFSDNARAAALTLSWGWLGNQWTMIPSFLNALSQSIMGLFYMYPIDTVYNSSIWTMPLFFLGGFLVAIVSQLTASLKRKWILYLLLILILAKSNYYLIIVGMILYDYSLFSRPFLSRPLVVGFLLSVCFFFGGYPYVYQTSSSSWLYSWLPVFQFTYTPTFYHGISAVSLLVLLINNRWMQRFFSLHFFTYFGARSFSLYLVHVVVILSIMSRLFITFLASYSYSIAFFMSLIISLLVTFILTELLYHLIEKRSGQISKYLFKQIA